MANSISVWYSTILHLAHGSTEPFGKNSSGFTRIISERAGINAHGGITRVLSPEEEIIIQMAKESPTLFMT